MKKNFECRLTALEKNTRIPSSQDNPALDAFLASMEMVDALCLARIAERMANEGGPLTDSENEALWRLAQQYS